jgi:hypothetical protein
VPSSTRSRFGRPRRNSRKIRGYQPDRRLTYIEYTQYWCTTFLCLTSDLRYSTMCSDIFRCRSLLPFRLLKRLLPFLVFEIRLLFVRLLRWTLLQTDDFFGFAYGENRNQCGYPPLFQSCCHAILAVERHWAVFGGEYLSYLPRREPRSERESSEISIGRGEIKLASRLLYDEIGLTTPFAGRHAGSLLRTQMLSDHLEQRLSSCFACSNLVLAKMQEELCESSVEPPVFKEHSHCQMRTPLSSHRCLMYCPGTPYPL